LDYNCVNLDITCDNIVHWLHCDVKDKVKEKLEECVKDAWKMGERVVMHACTFLIFDVAALPKNEGRQLAGYASWALGLLELKILHGSLPPRLSMLQWP
jgi:hypothetical protein